MRDSAVSSFAFSNVSTTFISNNNLRHKRQNSSFSTKPDFDEPSIFLSEKNNLNKGEISFRKSANLDQSASPPPSRNKCEPFLRNTSFFSVSSNSSPTT